VIAFRRSSPKAETSTSRSSSFGDDLTSPLLPGFAHALRTMLDV